FSQLTDAFNHMLTRIEGDQTRLQSQLGRLDLLYRITHATGARHDLPSLFRVVLHNLEEDLPVDFGCMCVCEAGADVLSIAVIGVRVAARRASESFSSPECEFLRQLSEHVALAAHQAQLYGALQRAYDDLRQSQQAMMQQERLRALGEMASGIAHDINNAISPIALYTESLLEREPGLSEHAREYLGTIRTAIE